MSIPREDASPDAPAVRIAWIIAGDEEGGVAQAVRGLISAVRSLGVVPLVIALEGGQFRNELDLFAPDIQVLGVAKPPSLEGSLLNKLRLQLQVLRMRRLIRPRLVKALRRVDASVVHVVWPSLMPVAARAALDVGAACVWEMPNILGRYPFEVNRRITQHTISRWGVTVLANSRYTASTLGDRPVKPIVFHLGADEKRYFPGGPDRITRTELGLPEGALVFGIFARLSAEKGQRLIIEAIAQLPRDRDAVHLLLVGGSLEGDYARQLHEQARKREVSDQLHMIGPVPDPERYYDAIDVAVNARIDPEPFGLSVVEAMLMGKPTLVHALGGPAETVVDGVTGWHVSEPTPEAFCAGLLRALDEREHWHEYGAAGRKRALEHFSLSREAREYVDIVRRIAESSRAARGA